MKQKTLLVRFFNSQFRRLGHIFKNMLEDGITKVRRRKWGNRSEIQISLQA